MSFDHGIMEHAERIAVVDALPRNAMGKVVRTGLVDLL